MPRSSQNKILCLIPGGANDIQEQLESVLNSWDENKQEMTQAAAHKNTSDRCNSRK